MALSLGFTDFVVMGGYAALAARVLRSLRSPAHVRATNRVFGGLFLVAGAFLALFKRGA
jgi:homoserine/homoserine lactone efflux protein